ncbi:MAG TPA: hypothetical protein VGA69_02580 [Nitriliruptorales bacterium]
MSGLGTTPSHTFQVTDMQRQYRQIVDAARSSRASIRDKDGVTLTLLPTEQVEHASALVGYVQALVQVHHAVRQPVGDRHVTDFGALAWASALDQDDVDEFVHEFEDALLVAASGGSIVAVEDLLYDWRTTARAASDEDLRRELLEAADAPLHDVEL